MSFNNRPHGPVRSEIFVKLVTENELRRDTVKKYYTTVKRSIPEGLLNHFEVAGPNGEPRPSALVHRVTDNGHEYEIPLYRNLTSNEIYEVAQNLNRQLTEGDYLFETSTPDEDGCCPEFLDEDGLYMDQDIYDRIAAKLAERVHNRWMQDRIDAGWRYGGERNDESKTHPLIKPWHRLTEDERHIDYEMPRALIDLLEEFGYTLVSEEEVDEMSDLITRKM